MIIKKHPYIAHILLLLVNIIYGANYTIAKAIMPKYISPYAFIFMRVFSAMIIYNIIQILFIKETIARKDNIRLILCGFFGVATNQLLFFKGISITSATHASLLMITAPIFTYIMFLIMNKTTGSAIKWIGIIIGAIGAGMLIFITSSSTSGSSVRGDLFVMINAMSYAIYLVLVKDLMSKYNPFTVITRVFSYGSIFVFIVCINDFTSVNWAAIPQIAYLNIAYVIIFATCIVYLFSIAAMKTLSPTVVSSYIYLQPLFAILIASIFANEKLTVPIIIAGIFIIFGIWMVTKKT